MSVTAVEDVAAEGAPDQRAGLRVLLFTNAWMMGGMERQILDLTRGLTQRGHRLTVLCFATPALDPFRAELRGYGVEVVELGGGPSPLGRLRRFWQVLRVLRSHRSAVLHLIESWPVGDGLVILAAKLAGIRAIVSTETWFEPNAAPPLLRRFAIRLRDRMIDRIVCVSRSNAEAVAVERDGRKVAVITNGIDETRFAPFQADGRRVRVMAKAGEGSVLVGTLGRMSDPRKGLSYFLDMARLLAEEQTDYRCAVAGDVDGEQSKTSDNVIFLGGFHEPAEFYAALDIFVMPSLSEGGPITVLEAMAMERPVVSTRVGMVPDVVKDGATGLIVPPGDARALASAVSKLTSDLTEAQNMGRRGRERVLSEFTLDAIVERYVDLYGELAARNSR